MDKRVLRIHDINGEIIREVDISDIDHADATVTVVITIETRCDMGVWHINSRSQPPPWGQRIKLCTTS